MQWSWPGAVALVLATAVGVGWSVAFVIAVLHPDELTRAATGVLYVLGGTMTGGVVGWLGGGRARHRKDEP